MIWVLLPLVFFTSMSGTLAVIETGRNHRAQEINEHG